eukprot:366301-Chlamydomonas_euryale.AAC.62
MRGRRGQPHREGGGKGCRHDVRAELLHRPGWSCTCAHSHRHSLGDMVGSLYCLDINAAQVLSSVTVCACPFSPVCTFSELRVLEQRLAPESRMRHARLSVACAVCAAAS